MHAELIPLLYANEVDLSADTRPEDPTDRELVALEAADEEDRWEESCRLEDRDW